MFVLLALPMSLQRFESVLWIAKNGRMDLISLADSGGSSALNLSSLASSGVIPSLDS